MDNIKSFFSSISDGFHGFFTAILSLITKLFLSVWTMITDIMMYVFDKLTDFIIYLLSQLDLSGITQYAGAFGQIPGEVLNVLGLIGIGDCFSVLLVGLGVRLILQLIPFVRLGS